MPDWHRNVGPPLPARTGNGGNDVEVPAGAEYRGRRPDPYTYYGNTAFNRVQATAALLLERQVVGRRNVSQMFATVKAAPVGWSMEAASFPERSAAPTGPSGE
jgi:hypothetical protein